MREKYPNTGKYGPGKLRIWTFFAQCKFLLKNFIIDVYLDPKYTSDSKRNYSEIDSCFLVFVFVAFFFQWNNWFWKHSFNFQDGDNKIPLKKSLMKMIILKRVSYEINLKFPLSVSFQVSVIYPSLQLIRTAFLIKTNLIWKI